MRRASGAWLKEGSCPKAACRPNGRQAAASFAWLLSSGPTAGAVLVAADAFGGLGPADILLQIDRQRTDSAFGPVTGAGGMVLGGKPTDG